MRLEKTVAVVNGTGQILGPFENCYFARSAAIGETICTVGQYPDGDTLRIIVDYTDAEGKRQRKDVESGLKAYGVCPAIVHTVGAFFRIAAMQSGDEVAYLLVMDNQLISQELHSVPNTSQGMRGFLNNVVVWGDPVQRHIAGRSLHEATPIGDGWWIGQDSFVDRLIAVNEHDGFAFTLADSFGRYPQAVRVNGLFTFVSLGGPEGHIRFPGASEPHIGKPSQTTEQPKPPVIIPPPTTKTGMFRKYDTYLKKRWAELGVEEKTEAVRQKTGVRSVEDFMALDDAHQHEAEKLFKEAQCPAFFQILGELHHVMGHKDVGAGRKDGGNMWQGMATDIIVIKETDEQGNVISNNNVQLIDAVSDMGGPDAGPSGWAVIAPNSDRRFVVPPVPADFTPVVPKDEPKVPGDSGPIPTTDLPKRADVVETYKLLKQAQKNLLSLPEASEKIVEKIVEKEVVKEVSIIREVVVQPSTPTYDESLSLAVDLAATYAKARGRRGGTLGPDTLAHLLFRYLREGYSREDLREDARQRGAA
jgi:hypothetical protein